MSKPPSDMPPQFIRRAPLNHRLQKQLEAAQNASIGIRELAIRDAWNADSIRGTRYGAAATVSQQKRRKVARRVHPHGWRGGRP